MIYPASPMKRLIFLIGIVLLLIFVLGWLIPTLAGPEVDTTDPYQYSRPIVFRAALAKHRKESQRLRTEVAAAK